VQAANPNLDPLFARLETLGTRIEQEIDVASRDESRDRIAEPVTVVTRRASLGGRTCELLCARACPHLSLSLRERVRVRADMV
jgi:hypothetical protein